MRTMGESEDERARMRYWKASSRRCNGYASGNGKDVRQNLLLVKTGVGYCLIKLK